MNYPDDAVELLPARRRHLPAAFYVASSGIDPDGTGWVSVEPRPWHPAVVLSRLWDGFAWIRKERTS